MRTASVPGEEAWLPAAAGLISPSCSLFRKACVYFCSCTSLAAVANLPPKASYALPPEREGPHHRPRAAARAEPLTASSPRLLLPPAREGRTLPPELAQPRTHTLDEGVEPAIPPIRALTLTLAPNTATNHAAIC